jgi:hypothetical protein
MILDKEEETINYELNQYFNNNYETVNGIDKTYFITQFHRYFKRKHQDIDGDYNVEGYAEVFLDEKEIEEKEKYSDYV